jgi:hypothetical protein
LKVFSLNKNVTYVAVMYLGTVRGKLDIFPLPSTFGKRKEIRVEEKKGIYKILMKKKFNKFLISKK